MLWSNQVRKKLLQQWVTSQQDPDCIEADLVISKSASKKKRGVKELLTTQEMIKREIPMEKIRAVVARGQGVPDEDCPDVPSLVRFWIHTSNVQIDEDEEKQEQRVKVQASGSAAIDGVFAATGPGSTAGLGADSMQRILEGLGKQPEGLIYTSQKCKYHIYYICCVLCLMFLKL